MDMRNLSTVNWSTSRACRGRVGRATIAGFCFFLSGCVDHRGDVSLYHSILEPANAAPTAYDIASPLSLHDALRRAEADNETIASRGEDYIQALAEKMRDAGTFLPTISLDPQYTLSHNSQNVGGTFITSGSSGTVQQTGGQGRLAHNISAPLAANFTGSLANVSTLQAATWTVEQRAQLLMDERQAILLSVAQSYYTALRAERQATTFETSLKVKAEKVRDQEARRRLGAVRPLDVAQSQADFASTQVSLIQAQTDAYNARSALARLMGVPSVDGTLTDDFVPPTKIESLDDWRRAGNAQRNDLRAARSATAASRLKVEAAIREYLPTVTINFDYFLYNDPRSGTLWTNGVSAHVPIFSALTIEADIRSAWSQYRQAGLLESQTARQVRDDINENYRTFLSSRQQVERLTVEVAAAQNAYDLAERAYQLGSDSNLDRLTQQDALLTAQLNLLSEEFSVKSSYLGLLRASGKLEAPQRQAAPRVGP